MIQILIKNYYDGSMIINAETLLYTIPLEASTNVMLEEPKLKQEMGKAGSFEFSMEPENPYYSALRQMKTIFTIRYDHEYIFRGRVLTIDTDVYGKKKVHCEGDLAFLLDSMFIGEREEKRQKITVNQYLTQLIENHNSMFETEDRDKIIELGEVPGAYSSGVSDDQKIENVSDKYGVDTWTSTLSCLEDLQNKLGGYFRTRREMGVVFLDWFVNYFNPTENSQPIEIGTNLMDISDTAEVDNLFTRVIPVGTKNGRDLYISEYWPTVTSGHKKVKYIDVPELVTLHLYSDSELNKGYHQKEEYRDAISNYGIIMKMVKFENADNETDLFNYAKDWIKNNYHGGMTSYSITAFDLHMGDNSYEQHRVGDRIRTIYPNPDGNGNTEISLTCLSIDYDLYNPENNSYSIGVPDTSLNKTYGEAKQSGGGGGSPKTPLSEDTEEKKSYLDHCIDRLKDKEKNAQAHFWDFVIDRYFTGEEESDEFIKNVLTPRAASGLPDETVLRADRFKAITGRFEKQTVMSQIKVGSDDQGSTSGITLDGVGSLLKIGDWSIDKALGEVDLGGLLHIEDGGSVANIGELFGIDGNNLDFGNILHLNNGSGLANIGQLIGLNSGTGEITGSSLDVTGDAKATTVRTTNLFVGTYQYQRRSLTIDGNTFYILANGGHW